MQAAYPDLADARQLILKVADNEETAFRRTLGRGLGLLQESIAQLEPGGALAGETAFMLYDTYGFPIDLTRLIMSEQGFAVDEEGFEAAMAAQRQRSRGELGVAGTERVYHQLAGEFGATEFTGYPADSQGLEGAVRSSVVADGVCVGRVTSGSSAGSAALHPLLWGERWTTGRQQPLDRWRSGCGAHG